MKTLNFLLSFSDCYSGGDFDLGFFFFLYSIIAILYLYRRKTLLFEHFTGTLYTRKALERKQDTLTTMIYLF